MATIDNASGLPVEDADAIKASKIVNVLYLIALIPPFFPLLSIIGLVVAYIFRQDARGWLQSHYQYLIRTFWIGMLYFVISVVLTFVIIGIVLMIALIVWWIVRCVTSFRLIEKQQPIQFPATWMV